jgi:two-component system phosphate regulon sensor histidine kinase PhoR
LENNINTQFDLFFICDRMRFKQVILNILWNAIKFTPHGGKIIIDSWIIKNKIHISIKDTWIWISADDIKKIFHKFWQVKNSLTRDIWWTWLGLSVSKAIIESFKWEIQVESKIGEGSNFIIILPNEFYFKF